MLPRGREETLWMERLALLFLGLLVMCPGHFALGILGLGAVFPGVQ